VTLPRAHGGAALAARFRSAIEDFKVEELPAFAPSGRGEHLLLTIEKRGMNTMFVAKAIARWAGVQDLDVGFAGLKDRNAVTRQRFSVRLPKKVAPDIASLEGDGVKVLEQHWHLRKLPRGALAGNRFGIVLREVVGDRATIESRLAAISTDGIPNYFGEQRFGRDGDNVDAARRMFAGARVGREQRGMLLSAARSEIFNAVLAARIQQGHWCDGLDGEVWMLDGTHSVFGPEPMTTELRSRARSLDIHATGPLWGRGELRSTGAVREIEAAVAANHGDLCTGLEMAGLSQERRALRVRVGDLHWQWPEDDVLRLEFSLPPGAYATSVLAELGDVTLSPTTPTPPPSRPD
jgi:tRNA pseudouridine13 synthase